MKTNLFLLIALFTASFVVAQPGFEPDQKNVLTFEPITAKFVRLDLTSNGEAPGIDELELFGPENPETNLATTKGAKATASSCISGYSIHRIKHLNDGKFGNDSSWIADPTDSHPFVCVELPEPMLIATVIFSRDLYSIHKDRVPAEIVVSVSQEGIDFTKITVAHYSLRPSPFGPPRPLNPWAAVHVPVVPPVQARGGSAVVNPNLFESEWLRTLVDEEYAWLKTYGYADIDTGLTNTPYPQQRHPLRKADDTTTLVRLNNIPVTHENTLSNRVSRGVVRVASPGQFEEGATSFYEIEPFLSGDNLYVSITSERFLSSNIAVIQTVTSSGIIALNETGKPVWRIYDSSNQPNDTLLKTWGNDEQNTIRFIVPLSFLTDIERGLVIRAGIGGRYTPNMGHPVYFYLSDIAVVPVETGKPEDTTFCVRFINHGDTAKEINGPDEKNWTLPPGETVEIQVEADNRNIGPERSLSFSIPTDSIEGQLQLLRYSPAERSFRLFDEMIDRLRFESLTPEQEQHLEWATKKRDEFATKLLGTADRKLFREIRQAKRELFFTDTGMEELSSVLFEKRHPLHPSHNYSDYYDSTWRAGGGIYRLDVPQIKGRFVPEEAKVTELFQTTGMSRHPVADFEATKIYFTNRPSQSAYWHIMEMNPDGSDLRQLTDGPFQDLWPCPLPDGDLAFISTRCKQRFLCWEPQASVLFRMDKNGEKMKRLSFANLTEFAPSVARDGRILWTRSEYLDKGADYGHTLWYIRPDGTTPELTFGNTITLPQGYANGREIPGSNEISCVMISHFGDLNGPVAILDIDQGRLNPDAITSITPEVPWPGYWASCETFREPFPLSKNIFLVSHAPRGQFALFVIDRFGNRELLSIDGSPERLGSMCPTPLRSQTQPSILPSGINPTLAEENRGIFMIEDVYKGIDHVVPRGSAKYIRVCQEMPHFLEKNSDGTYRASYQPFWEFYASPVDLIAGPYGWTSYVAKGDLGTVEVEEDGSAIFYAPANSVLFFELLDENYDEIQRMRSVVQLQPGESRSCVGCHEDRTLVPERRPRTASQQTPRELTPSPWGAGPFDYQKVVQPVLDKNCVSCHGETDTVNLTGILDTNFIPASYVTMIRGGYVHHFHWGFQAGVPTKAEPYTFGTMQSTLWSILNDENHQAFSLNTTEERAIKTWVDLSCPLWPNYTQRSLRDNPNAHDGITTE